MQVGGQDEFRNLQTGIFCDFSSGGNPKTIQQLNSVCFTGLPYVASLPTHLLTHQHVTSAQ